MVGCAFGEEVAFAIQSRDETGVDRTTGGDEFDVEVISKDSSGAEVNCLSSIEFDDFQNGKYLVRYQVDRPGKFAVRVFFKGSFGGTAGPLLGSGSSVEFVVGAPAQNNLMSGPLALKCLSEDISMLNSMSKETGEAIFVRLKDESWTLDEQIRVLVTVKGRLQVVDKRSPEISLLIARCEALLRYLRIEGHNVDTLFTNLSGGTSAWEKIVREAPQIQNRIIPLMRAQLPKIRADVHAIEGRLQAYLKGLGSAAFRTYNTGVGKAIDLLDKADAICVKERQSISRLVHITSIFDCERETLNSKNILTEIEELLRDFRHLWVCIAKSVNVIESAKNILWASLDPEAFEDNAKLLVQTAKKLPKSVKQSDAFKGLDRITKDFLCTCPLISALRSPAMRDRHWKELMGIVKKQFAVPTLQSGSTIKQLLELELHKVANDVEELTDKATKEAKHENVLGGLEITWGDVKFTMSYYKETDIPLLKMEDLHIEQLESDQLAVQSIVGGRYPFFKAKAVEWQGVLATISDVTQVLSEIQRTWCYLEPLFIGSEEVKKELPADAAKFKEIDREVRYSFLYY
jgi:dynein heavy chain